MPIINHVSYDCESPLESIIIKTDGSPLYGEIEMFRRIFSDCSSDEQRTWHFWHDLTLHVPVRGQSEIQIDFLLVCEEGAVIVEVKGGSVGVEQGRFYFNNPHARNYMDRTPFEQAEDYKYALLNNRIIDPSDLFVDTVCAFPHTDMKHTSNNPNNDLGYKLWSSSMQEDANMSFADFCSGVLQQDKHKKSYRRPDMTVKEVGIAINSLLFNFKDRTYSERTTDAILTRLKIDNLSSFNSLRKNERLFIEGGPGTGKTTIAKAYIEKYHTLRGLYVCWNKLLKAKIENEIARESNCEVFQFASFVFCLQRKMGTGNISLEEIEKGIAVEKLEKLFDAFRSLDDFMPYDYIIVDEAQDVLDKGAVQLLNSLSSSRSGLSYGHYLVFYDTEQGYDYENRQISDIADSVALNGARFVLDVNRRVPTNTEIVSYAAELRKGASAKNLLDMIGERQSDAVRIFYCDGRKSLISQINSVKQEIRENSGNWNDYVVLMDSKIKCERVNDVESLYDRIVTIDGMKELSVENLCVESGELQCTSILSFKGLECRHVILVIDGLKNIDEYELYVGMTRAIVDLRLLILN